MMKKNCTLVLIISFLWIQNVYAEPIVGYGSSDFKFPKKSQEIVYMGFEAGLNITLKNKSHKEYIILEQVFDGSPLGAAKSAKHLIEKGARFIIGFPTSYEALLAAEAALKKNTFAIFAGAGHSKISELGNHIFSLGESMEYSITYLLKFMVAHYPNQKGLVIVNPISAFSTNQEQMFKKLLTTNGAFEVNLSKLSLEFVNLDEKLEFSEETLINLKRNDYNFIHITSYVQDAFSIMRQMQIHGIDLPIIANSSWSYGDVELLKRYLADRNSPTYGFSQWFMGGKESGYFEQIIKRTYGSEPTARMAYGFDLGVVIGTIFNRIEGVPTKEKFIHAFKSDLCFEKTSSGKICLPESGGHAVRKIFSYTFKDRGKVFFNNKE